MREPPIWETDFRWRRVRVSSEMLDEWFRGPRQAVRVSTAPPDLLVVGLARVETRGVWEFVVWSATFEPVPHGDDLPYEPYPFVDFEYST